MLFPQCLHNDVSITHLRSMCSRHTRTRHPFSQYNGSHCPRTSAQIIILSTVSWEPGANLTWEHTSIHVCSWIWTRIWHPRIRAHTNLYVCVCVCMGVCLFVRGCLFVFCFSLYVCVHLSFHVARSSQKKIWEHIQAFLYIGLLYELADDARNFVLEALWHWYSPTKPYRTGGFVKLLWPWVVLGHVRFWHLSKIFGQKLVLQNCFWRAPSWHKDLNVLKSGHCTIARSAPSHTHR